MFERWRSLPEGTVRHLAQWHHQREDYAGDEDPTVEWSREELIAFCAEGGATDAQIGAWFGWSPHTVRAVRRRAAIRGNRYRSGWEAVLTAAWRRGLDNAAIARATGYTRRTVQELLSRLGLPSHRRCSNE